MMTTANKHEVKLDEENIICAKYCFCQRLIDVEKTQTYFVPLLPFTRSKNVALLPSNELLNVYYTLHLLYDVWIYGLFIQFTISKLKWISLTFAVYMSKCVECIECVYCGIPYTERSRLFF